MCCCALRSEIEEKAEKKSDRETKTDQPTHLPNNPRPAPPTIQAPNQFPYRDSLRSLVFVTIINFHSP